jgi:hypothetical protein
MTAMRRTTLGAIALLGLVAGPARADTVPQIVNVPDTYTPGTPFTFQVRVPGLADFASYSVQLLFETEVSNPNLSVSFAPNPSQYPFPSSAGFTVTPVPPSSGDSTYVYTISDSGPLTFTTPGTKDLLANVTVLAGADVGAITIEVGGDTTLDYNKEGRRDTLPGPSSPITPLAGGTTPVPAPAGIVLLGIGSVLLAARKRVLRAV